MRPRTAVRPLFVISNIFIIFIIFILLISSLLISPVFSILEQDAVRLNAGAENQPPVAVGGNITVEEPGKMVFFSAVGSHDPDGEIVFYEWDFQGDGVYDWNSTENGNTEFSFEKEGAYNATLRVTDDNSTSSTDVYYVLILEKEDNSETDYDRIKTVLTVVGFLEIAAGIGIFAVILYLKHKLYDVL